MRRDGPFASSLPGCPCQGAISGHRASQIMCVCVCLCVFARARDALAHALLYASDVPTRRGLTNSAREGAGEDERAAAAAACRRLAWRSCRQADC